MNQFWWRENRCSLFKLELLTYLIGKCEFYQFGKEIFHLPDTFVTSFSFISSIHLERQSLLLCKCNGKVLMLEICMLYVGI